jgi:hypothetical protein
MERLKQFLFGIKPQELTVQQKETKSMLEKLEKLMSECKIESGEDMKSGFESAKSIRTHFEAQRKKMDQQSEALAKQAGKERADLEHELANKWKVGKETKLYASTMKEIETEYLGRIKKMMEESALMRNELDKKEKMSLEIWRKMNEWSVVLTDPNKLDDEAGKIVSAEIGNFSFF